MEHLCVINFSITKDGLFDKFISEIVNTENLEKEQ